MQALTRAALIAIEIAILTALILATRCANYPDVFVAGNVYFTDADCYARMTRVRMCAEHPGLIVRHHDFENFPQGTIPHTSAPLDYLILGLSILLKPFTTHALDLAGALVSPLLALSGGWFLWWWSRRMKFRYRWAALILYAISPILVHGAELGRPDHQSLLMLLVMIAICAEWMLQNEPSRSWGAASGVAWGLAAWVSAYEPLFLLVIVIVLLLVLGPKNAPHSGAATAVFGRHRGMGWILFGMIVVFALVVERRLPSLSIFYSSDVFRNWTRIIGELLPVSPLNPIWFGWAGYMIAVAPLLIWSGFRTRTLPPKIVLILLAATFFLTIWQARWAYFFMLIFAIALPSLLEPIKSRAAVWTAFILSIFPILRDWDGRIWPNEAEISRRSEHRREGIELRELSTMIQSPERHPFLGPWWLSPAIAYWSGQPGIAGSSHESLSGIADSARFYLATDSEKTQEILKSRGIDWVLAYDSDRVAENSATVLGVPVPERPLCRSIDRTPAQAPRFLTFSGQNGTGKLFRVANRR